MLARRAIADELMDADDLALDTYAAVMADLARVNTLTMARRPTLDFISRLTKSLDDARPTAAHDGSREARTVTLERLPLRILDVGYGDGDMLRAIHHWGMNRSVSLTLVGIDLNPRSEAAARDHTPSEMQIDYRTGDYADLAGEGFDIILSSLVAHHMTHDQLVAFVRFMDREARAGWFVNDLHRHGLAWAGFPLLARMMAWHPIVRHDGQLSIARSFRPDEWPSILADAGVEGAQVQRVFPFRLCVAKTR